MRKTLLLFLTVLFMAPILSGCFYPYYRDDWNGRGYRYERGHRDYRDYDGHRDGNRDYRDYRDRR